MTHTPVATGALAGVLFLTSIALTAEIEDRGLELLGVRLTADEGRVVASEVRRDGPAFRGGVRDGDTLLSVDGVTVADAAPEQVLARMLTPRRDPIRLLVARARGGRQEVLVARPPTDELLTIHPSLAGDAGLRPVLPGPHSTGRPEVISRAGVAVGDPLVDFTLPRLDGQGDLSLGELRGKPIFLDFWATWCMPCRAEAPALALLHEYLGDRIQMVGVTIDRTPEAARSYVAENGHDYIQLVGALRHPGVQAYGVHRTGIPLNVLIDADGTIVAIDLHGEPLARAMESLVGAGGRTTR